MSSLVGGPSMVGGLGPGPPGPSPKSGPGGRHAARAKKRSLVSLPIGHAGYLIVNRPCTKEHLACTKIKTSFTQFCCPHRRLHALTVQAQSILRRLQKI